MKSFLLRPSGVGVKMITLFSVFFLVFTSMTTPFHDVKDNYPESGVTVDIIILEDDFVRVTTEGDGSLIETMIVFDSFGNIQYENSGCNADFCEYDLSALDAGQYLIKIFTTDNESADKWIYLN